MSSDSRFTCVSGPDKWERQLAAFETVLDAESGAFVHSDRDCTTSITLPTVLSVCVADESDVAFHEVLPESVTVTHRIRFKGGGLLQLVLGSQGEFISCWGRQLQVKAGGDRLIVSGLPAEP